MIKTSLFDLIHSMSMSEKRYFKLYSAKHVIGESNDYIHLFNAIDKQKTYNEEDLNSFNFVKNLSAEKNYLYRQLLKALNSYHEKLNSKTIIQNYLNNIELLYHKGLYDQALRIAKKALILARNNDLFTHELAIKEIEAEIMSKQLLYTEALNNIQRSEEVIKVVQNFISIQKAAMESYESGLKIGAVRSVEDKKIINKIINKKAIKTINYSMSARATMYRLSVLLAYYYLINDENNMLIYTKKLSQHYQENTFLIEYSTIGYIFSLSSLSRAYLKKEEYKKAEKTLLLIESIQHKYNIKASPHIKARIFFYCINIRMEIAFSKDDYKHCENIISNNLKELNKHLSFIEKPILYDCYFLFAKYFFVKGSFKKALIYSNEIINDLSFKSRKDLLAAIRLLNLLIHFELNKDFTLDYLTKNTFNYFKKRKRLFKVEDELIRFMKNQNKIQSKQIVVDDLIQLKERMRHWKNHKYESSPFQKFDFEYWAESKLQNKSIINMKLDSSKLLNKL